MLHHLRALQRQVRRGILLAEKPGRPEQGDLQMARRQSDACIHGNVCREPEGACVKEQLLKGGMQRMVSLEGQRLL